MDELDIVHVLAATAAEDAAGSPDDFCCYVDRVRAVGHYTFEAFVVIEGGSEYYVRIYAPEWWESVETKIYEGEGKPVARHWLKGPNGWELAGKFGFLPIPVCSHSKKRTTTPKADRALDRLRLLLPRRQREDILGDLREDVVALRKEGYSEKVLCYYVRWQAFCAAVERLKPWNWAAFAWLVHKFIR